MKVWITKYALTEGIIETEGEQWEEHPSMIVIRRPGRLSMFAHGEGKEWCASLPLALRRAEEMRLAKVASLKKQLAKVQTAEIKVVVRP